MFLSKTNYNYLTGVGNHGVYLFKTRLDWVRYTFLHLYTEQMQQLKNYTIKFSYSCLYGKCQWSVFLQDLCLSTSCSLLLYLDMFYLSIYLLFSAAICRHVLSIYLPVVLCYVQTCSTVLSIYLPVVLCSYMQTCSPVPHHGVDVPSVPGILQQYTQYRQAVPLDTGVK